MPEQANILFIINQHYIHADNQRRGMASQLVELAKKLSPGKLQHYTFECNDQTRFLAEAWHHRHLQRPRKLRATNQSVDGMERR
jgi:hypothetical protein